MGRSGPPLVGRLLNGDLVEAERILDAVAHRLQDGVDVVRLGQPSGYLEHALEHALVLDVVGGVLGNLQSQRGVARDGHERLELGVGRAPAGLRLVDRDRPEEVAAAVAQGHEQGVAGQPGIWVLARGQLGNVGVDAERLPVELAVG